MSVSQSEFTSALFNPDVAPPLGLKDPQGRPAGRRFSVYRNNVAVSLTEALETAFPVVRKLVGDEFFRATAGIYLRQHPPKSPLLMQYGEDFPDFLSGFPPASSLGYLPDVARLEVALRVAYHAADTAPLDASAANDIDPSQIVHARLGIAPAVRVLESDWPIHSIWRANMEKTAPKPSMRPECVLITRPAYDPRVTLISKSQAEVVRALISGQSILASISAASETPDMQQLLGELMAGEAITKITHEAEK